MIVQAIPPPQILGGGDIYPPPPPPGIDTHDVGATTKLGVPFVLTYHPTSELVVIKAIRDNLNILQTDETTSDVFSDPPLISYRKDRSLKQVLVKSSLPSLSEEGESSDNSVGTPCRRPRCKTCGVISPATGIKGPNPFGY